jgi:hypothetical protein
MTINNIAWSFNKDCYTDPQAFDLAVSQYQRDIYDDQNRWKPSEIVFNVPELQIQYTAWVSGPQHLLENEALSQDDLNAFDGEPEADEYGYQVEIVAKLMADNGKHFTALEFLYKVHNQQANKELGDHVFFEGTDSKPQMISGLPTYYIACGS